MYAYVNTLVLYRIFVVGIWLKYNFAHVNTFELIWTNQNTFGGRNFALFFAIFSTLRAHHIVQCEQRI